MLELLKKCYKINLELINTIIMVNYLRHEHFFQSGYYAAVSMLKNKQKIYTNHLNEFQENVAGVSQLISRDLLKLAHLVKKQTEKITAQYILNNTFNNQKNQLKLFEQSIINKLGEINYHNIVKNTLHNSSKKNNINKFLTIGFCIGLASISLLQINSFYNQNRDITNQETTTEKNQAVYMTSVFKTKIEAFTNLLNITEGESHTFYKDNLGVATAYGWNPTKNSKFFNLAVAHKIGMTTLQTKEIEKISDNSTVKSVPKNLKKVVLSDKQVKKSAEYMMNFYESEFLKVLKIKAKQHGKDYQKILNSYHHLPTNQQAVMVHMAYKVGTPNLLKYNNFFSTLFVYMDNPTDTNLQSVSDNFSYSYKNQQGQRLHDTRVEDAHSDFFNSCSIHKELNYDKAEIAQQVKSCRKLVANKTIKLTNKG